MPDPDAPPDPLEDASPEEQAKAAAAEREKVPYILSTSGCSEHEV